ncbi:hypothetical protein J8Z28_17575 [Pseudoalteromonas sp. SCSIO 43088]|uniref:hypothetical protein n=1 Tax=Pseudoalteromonas sp. SCSIO 43088 TaxID=2822846 RepID=UPI00202B2DA3|nr:hypothetical protein [Pseudoalteromonas sp. SCSIO 43088]URQ86302.1 hypothetical protein J8Z28_17575 [Pseudoalteromonas sp. SCSIO 43088]
MNNQYTINKKFKVNNQYLCVRNETFSLNEVSLTYSFIDWEKGIISSSCDIYFDKKLYDPQIKKLKWFFSNDLSKEFKVYLYELFERELEASLGKELSFIEKVDEIKSLNDEKDSKKIDYVLMKSKVVGVHETVFIGKEWVEGNSNRLGLDRYENKYEYYFTPHYHVINLELKSNKASVINDESRQHLDTEGYDWIHPLPIEDTFKLFEELDIHITKGNTIYTRQLEPVRLIKPSKEYNKVINTPFKKHRIFYHFEDVFIPSFKKKFINDCMFNIINSN